MTEYILAVAVALGYGIWFLALVREQRERAALEALPGLLAALAPAARQAAADIEAVGRAFSKLAPAVKEANRCLTSRSR